MATRIMIDAGHGGWDNGAMQNGRKEKDDNLDLALAVGELLREKGFEVLYTRTEDVYQSPNEKARIANRENVDYFISLHRNASPNTNQYSGVQTLIYNDGDIKQVIADNINSQLEKVGFINLGRSIRKDLAVLRLTNMPAVLVETGFINTDADNQLFDQKFNEIANAIAIGVAESVGGETQMPFTYRIQVGLFRNYNNAERLANELRAKGYTVSVEKMGEYYAVLVGQFTNLQQAENIERVLQQDGYDTIIVAL